MALGVSIDPRENPFRPGCARP